MEEVKSLDTNTIPKPITELPERLLKRIRERSGEAAKMIKREEPHPWRKRFAIAGLAIASYMLGRMRSGR
jgi:hypothetical protein